MVHGLAGAADADFLAVQEDGAGGQLAVLAEQGGHQLGAAGTHESGDAEDLALPEVEVHAFQDFAGWILRVQGVQARHLEEHLAGLALALGEALGHLPADHQVHHLGHGELGGGQGGHHAAVPEHGNGVGGAEELFQLVADVEAGHALGLEGHQDLHELVHLGRRQGGGGLVQDQHLGVFRQRLGDLGHLHLAHPQILDQGVRRDVQLEPLEQRGGLGVQPVPVDGHAVARLLAQEDVLPHRHVGDEGEFLVDDGDALVDGLADGCVAQLKFVAVQLDRPGVGAVGVDPAQDLHQGGLAGAVLPAQSVDFASPHLDAHVGEGVDPGESLGYAGNIEDQVLVHRACS